MHELYREQVRSAGQHVGSKGVCNRARFATEYICLDEVIGGTAPTAASKSRPHDDGGAPGLTAYIAARCTAYANEPAIARKKPAGAGMRTRAGRQNFIRQEIDEAQRKEGTACFKPV